MDVLKTGMLGLVALVVIFGMVWTIGALARKVSRYFWGCEKASVWTFGVVSFSTENGFDAMPVILGGFLVIAYMVIITTVCYGFGLGVELLLR